MQKSTHNVPGWGDMKFDELAQRLCMRAKAQVCD